MSELDELRAELSKLRREVDEIRESQSDHLGFDWGNTGPNYPHPNQQIAVAEFGGGIMRLDSDGQQVITAGTNTPAIFFVGTGFSTDPATLTSVSQLLGNTTDTDTFLQLYSLIGSNTSVARTEVTDALSQALLEQVFGSNTARLTVYADADEFYTKVRGALFLYATSSDPSVPADAEIWYRSDLDKFRGQADGVIDNFAMEAWVTAGFPAIAGVGSFVGAYKDADQEVTTTTLATDSELTVSLAASSKYHFTAHLFILNDGAAEGFKVAITGTVGITDLKAQAIIFDDTLNSIVGFARITAIDTAVGAAESSGSNYARVEGTIETTTAGTFALSFAQNAAGANAGVHMEVGSSLVAMRTE